MEARDKPSALEASRTKRLKRSRCKIWGERILVMMLTRYLKCKSMRGFLARIAADLFPSRGTLIKVPTLISPYPPQPLRRTIYIMTTATSISLHDQSIIGVIVGRFQYVKTCNVAGSGNVTSGLRSCWHQVVVCLFADPLLP